MCLCGFQGIEVIGCLGPVTNRQLFIYDFIMLFYGIDVKFLQLVSVFMGKIFWFSLVLQGIMNSKKRFNPIVSNTYK